MTTSAPDTPTRTPRLVLAILAIGIIATPVLAFPYVLLDRTSTADDLAAAYQRTRTAGQAGAVLLAQ